MKVLIVEDEEATRESLAEYLQVEGYDVAAAGDGAEALAWLERESPPCLVILDLIMPAMSGNDLFSRMRSDARWRRVPVVVSTSDPSRAPLGVPVMPKPVDLPRLLEVVRAHCRGRSR